MSPAVLPLAMLAAWLVDLRWGEPAPRWHPVVGFGRALAFMGARIRRLPPRPAFVAGALAWSLGAVVVTALAWALQSMLLAWAAPWGGAGIVIGGVVLGLMLKPLFAWAMLRDEVAAVETALGQSLGAGRARIARISSRDSSGHEARQIRETAIETLAENLNDSVVAPLFWFAVAGLPGAALYRWANTADAMWGCRGEWEWAGKWAARADDLLSWIPARLTALALLPAPRTWVRLAHEARITPSPNGRWPMGAMAIALDCRLAKPGVYVLCPEAPCVSPGDVARAIERARCALWRAVPALMLLAVLGTL